MRRFGRFIGLAVILFFQWFLGVMYGITDGKNDWVKHGAASCFIVEIIMTFILAWAYSRISEN
jgi:hypothetical protein